MGKMVQGNLEGAQALGAYHWTRVYRLEYYGFPGSKSAEVLSRAEPRLVANCELVARRPGLPRSE